MTPATAPFRRCPRNGKRVKPSHPPLCHPREGARPTPIGNDRFRSRARRPALELTGCDAEGIAATSPCARAALVRSSPPSHLPSPRRAGVRDGVPACRLRIPVSAACPHLAARLRARRCPAPCHAAGRRGATTSTSRGHRHPHRGHRRRRTGAGRGDRPRTDRRRSQARSLPDLLRGRAGITIVQPGRRRASSPRCSCAAPNPTTCWC